ncbi:MAG TPA: hypothetical protein VEH07_06980, partial [Alphaproteobacteria bacterium]|nr:hypothetical protein [Alphaproteobacteria bacterium]
LLRLFYWRKSLFFIDHLVFSFYLHAGVFVFLIVDNLLESILPGPLASYSGDFTLLAALAFVIWSACGYYRQSIWLTLAKWLAISVIYIAALGLATTAAALIVLGNFAG